MKDELKSLRQAKSDIKFLQSIHSKLSKLPEELKNEAIKLMEREVGGICADVHQYSQSWAVICIQGKKSDFIKFVDLPDKQIRDIARFLSQFDRQRINADVPGNLPRELFFRL